MKFRLVPAILVLLFTACQRGESAPARMLTAPPAPVQLFETTPTINIVTQVEPTRTLQVTQAKPEVSPTEEIVFSPAPEVTVDRPLLIPRILQADYSPQVTRIVIGFDIHPAYRGYPDVIGEIYDATLTDQAGHKIEGISIERSEPDKSTLEFAPLPPGVISLTLRAELALRGVPAQNPIVIEVSDRPLDLAWPIQAKVRFGDVELMLHTARLLREESNAPPNAKQQVSLELRGENADLNGAQLICLALTPLPTPTEGSMSCGQEPGGIDATVSLGPVVDRTEPLPMPTGLVILQASADFLLPGYWETSWPVDH